MARHSSKKKPKQRNELLYGRQAVREALRAGRRKYLTLYLARGVKSSPLVEKVIEQAREISLPVEPIDRRQLDEWFSGANHQGLALRTGPYPYAPLPESLALARARQQDPLFLLLDRVQDPQNLGTLLRTAEACGVHAVVLPRHRSAHVTPAVVNASAGAVEHLLVCQETNLVSTMHELRREGLWIAGLEAHPDALLLDDVDLSGGLAIVVGSEGYGLSRLVSETCDWLVKLPMAGRINSLNAAVAGSILLYHVMQQRGP